MGEPPVLRVSSKQPGLPPLIDLSKGPILFGRSGECDISFDDPKNKNMISRLHARISRLQEGGKDVFQIEDLKSTNGVLVNFLRIEKAILSDGDKITFGGAGKRPQNVIVSNPNSTVVYEFRWRPDKRRLVAGEDPTATKKRKTNDGAVSVKLKDEAKKGKRKDKEDEKDEDEDEEEDEEEFEEDEEDESSEVEKKSKGDDKHKVSPQKEDNETIASRNRRSRRGQGEPTKKRKKKNRITLEETLEPLFKLRKINSRPALEGGKRFKGQLIFKALDDGKSILEYTSEVLKSSRIRHMVVQPNEGGAITLIHIYLVKPIRIGKHVKKTQHIQFFQEALRKDNSKHINIRFLRFGRTIERAKVSFSLDIKPKRKLRFEGITGDGRMASLQLQPTNHCLVSLNAHQPFFIVMYDCVEIVYFERVNKVSRTFDMVFVTKEHGDYQTVHINHISSTHLERLAAYFEQLKMKVYKGSASLDWEEVLEYVVNEPEDIKKNGWKFIAVEDEQDNQVVQQEDEDSEDASDFAPHSGDDFDELAFDDGEEDL